MNFFNYLFIVVVYFSISIGFPWQLIDSPNQTISYSYAFDFIYVILASFALKVQWSNQTEKPIVFGTRVILIIMFVGLILGLIIQQQIPAPFALIDHIAIKMLILAPLLEELVFRHLFFQLGDKAGIHPKLNTYINAFFFSLSHLPAYWLVPDQYQKFILIQLGYTFILGLLCASAAQKKQMLIYPIILHFVFNLAFWFAVDTGALAN